MLTRRTLCFLSAGLLLRCDRSGISAPQLSSVEPVEAQVIESVLQLSNVEPVEAQIIESVLHHLDERKRAATFMHLSAEARLDETLKNRAKSLPYLREKLGTDNESLNRLFDRNSVSHRWPQNITLPEGFRLDARGFIGRPGSVRPRIRRERCRRPRSLRLQCRRAERRTINRNAHSYRTFPRAENDRWIGTRVGARSERDTCNDSEHGTSEHEQRALHG